MIASKKQVLIYATIICLLLMSACQKGIHWDLPSEGALLKDAVGNCMPISVLGTFITKKPINDSDFLTVSIDVVTAGTYSITSDSINGYSFKASGIFNNKGITQVKLTGSGSPLIAGTDHFNIHYNSSDCEAFVTVLSDTIPVANYTLQGSPNNCMNDTIGGSYLQSVELDTADKVTILVNVNTPGSYSIMTNTVNGYSFSGSGVFTTAGVQPVIINGSGMPIKAGTDLFIVNANNNTCNFSVNVAAIVSVNTTSHFPLTAGSYWTYINPVFNDTTKRYVNGDSLISNTDYVKVIESSAFKTQNYFYNYNGGDYNEFGEVEKYNSSFGYSPPVYGLIPFLKESLAAGTSWESETFKGTASFGQVLYFKYGYYCAANNAIKIINGFGFKNVYVIDVYPQLKSEGNSWGNTNEVYHYYYAEGIGLVSLEESLPGYDVHPVLQIVDWKVN